MRLTVQGWQNLVLSVMGVVVLSGAVGGALLMSRTDQVSGELIDHIQPARVAAYELQAALRDQETAVRGYAIAADAQFWRLTKRGNAMRRHRPKSFETCWPAMTSSSGIWTRSNARLSSGGPATRSRSSRVSLRGDPSSSTAAPRSGARANSTAYARFSMSRTLTSDRRATRRSTN